MKLSGYKVVDGIIHCVEGLRIGGTKEAAGIGEVDNPIIRHPVTRLPYIPGSSLKGRIRSLIEWREGAKMTKKNDPGKPCGCGQCNVCLLFGSDIIENTRSPTRLIFRDARLTDVSRRLLEETLPGSFIEDKTEIAMDRRIGATKSGSLRQVERVPADTQFHFSFTMRLFDTDLGKRTQFWEWIARALDDLEKDYLGGCGTRGYGQVKFLTADGSAPLAPTLKA